MNRKTLTFLFLGIAIVLAILLVFNVINPLISGLIFAVALVAYGMLSNGKRTRG
jgi:hypothetical protein